MSDEMEDLLLDDVIAEGDQMYVAAKRYVAVFEAAMTQPDCFEDEDGHHEHGPTIGTSGQALREAVEKYAAAQARWDPS